MRLLPLALLLIVATPQDQSSVPPIPVRLIVTDAAGRPVANLSASDVEIAQGSKPQKIERLVYAPAGPRKIGILLDEYHVAAGPSSERTRAALMRFVESGIRAGDVVFVMNPLDPASTLAPVSSHEQLRDRISGFTGRKGDFTPRTPFESEYMSAAPPAAVRQRAQVVRAAMQALVTALRRGDEGHDTPGALIVLTEGFAPEDRGRERLASLRTVARAARMANVPVYVLDPSPAPATPSSFTEQWRLLAAQTGGVITTGGAPLEPALAQVASDLQHHYLATIAGPVKEDGAYHAVDVKVKRRGASVRAPAGYWAPIAAERYTAPVRPAMSTYLKTPHVSGVIQPWFRMAKGSAGQTRVTFSWGPRGTRTQAASVTFSAVTFDGVRVHDERVLPQQHAMFQAVPGPIQVSMVITDTAGKLIDTEVRYLDIPRLDGPGTIITAVEVVRTRTLREFLERQTQPDVLPADTRDFQRQDRLIVRVRALAGSDDVPKVTARLLNRRGQPMRDLTSLPEVDGVPQFDLPLAPFARGDYHIEIKATTGSSSVSQLVTFRLVG